MTVGAGIDIGNSTTEVVLARVGPERPAVVGAGRAPTRRAKGSPESLDGAAALVHRLERQYGVRVQVAVAAKLRPVSTLTAMLPEPLAATGRLQVLATGVGTAGGRGFGIGRPRLLDAAGDEGRVVAVVPPGTGYLGAVEPLRVLRSAGRLAGVLLADDEAVLVANRLGRDVPVVDEVDIEAVLASQLVAVEVGEPGAPLRLLTDPLRLMAVFGLGEGDRADAARVASRLYDASNAVVSLGPAAAAPSVLAAGWVEVEGSGRLPFTQAHPAVAAGRVGAARAYALPPGHPSYAVDDLWTVDLSSVADTVLARAGAQGRAVGLAMLRTDAPYSDPSPGLSRRLGVPVRTAPSEGVAARSGALSTPGAGPDSVVIDLGGGTVDAIAGERTVVAAGGGELLTMSVAALTGTTGAAAEWVKRGPARRVEAPQVLLGEDGSREFLDRPAPPETLGALVVRGPAGLLAFHRVLAPGEWRALRLRLKVELIGGNVARALRTLDAGPSTVVVVGGPAGDDEVLGTVARALPAGTAVGRGDVGGSLGHRYAVAYGLLVGT